MQSTWHLLAGEKVVNICPKKILKEHSSEIFTVLVPFVMFSQHCQIQVHLMLWTNGIASCHLWRLCPT